MTPYIGGVLPFRSLAQLQAEEREIAQKQNNTSYVTNLAAHIRKKFCAMSSAKRDVEQRLLSSLRQRRGEYEPDKLAAIRQQGGSEIYLMLSPNKARAASSWIRDVLSGAGSDKPWTVRPTPNPDIPPQMMSRAYQEMRQELERAQALGIVPTESELEAYVAARKRMVQNQVMEMARSRSENMERKMEDQLAEGRFTTEFNKFIDDLVTFPYAVMKGPVVRKQRTFKWVPTIDGDQRLETVDEIVPTWARVDPFKIYWSAHATTPDEGDLCELHELSRAELNSLIGVEGYSDEAIRAVLDEYGRGGLREWVAIASEKATAEGKDVASVTGNPDELIDAIQFWGSVQGKMLVEWGLDESEVEDPLAEYPIEGWLIGNWVIKAMVNPDPLSRKPYFKTSYEEVPGSWCGNSPMDLIRDCQDVCNATARALVNNLGIASGPQVWMNVDRLPAGEQITQMYPWKIHQFISDPMGNTAPPIGFFQPNSLASELMGVYEKFSTLADEYSGIPRYMTGDNNGIGGAGRTASGMSMLMNNAGKTIKQVLSNIDRCVFEPLIERLWFHNMKYSDDLELKGDVKVVARGAISLVHKETTAQRRNELLQMVLTNPLAQQIMGVEGAAHLLREQVAALDGNTDKIIAPPEVIKARMAMQQMMAPMMQGVQGTQGAQPTTDSGQTLIDGAPVVDNFSPMSMGVAA